MSPRTLVTVVGRCGLRAGEALSAAWLTATELGVSVVPLSATMVTATAREEMRRVVGGPGYLYLVLRLDTIESDDPTGPYAPRLPAEQTIERRRC